MTKYREPWRRIVAEALRQVASQSGASAPAAEDVVMETPPKPELGDIGFPMFPFARVLRKAPAAIAQDVARLASQAPAAAGLGEARAEGPYVNVRLAPAPVIDDVLKTVAAEGEAFGRTKDLAGQKVMLEFSCPNTNKPLHLGHLRN
ncbi:MAG TPA: arginine--tRNA ligase, partial [Spirochaetia bacterium]|nr:arginine--tRNA ligase [Spirochaetia bacterium]